jgi:DNA-binding NarL/FixJ family response regulator
MGARRELYCAMVPASPRVWIDDRHPIFRWGLRACLRQEGFTVSGESARLDPRPDLATTDILVFEASPGTLRRAVTFGGEVRLVAMVDDACERLLTDAIEAGVAAILLRTDLAPTALVGSLRAVATGNTTVPPDVLPRLLRRAARTGAAESGALNERETDVLRHLSEGLDTREIALELAYSERTVKTIVHDLLVKMNCRNRAHAVALATRQGLI